MSAVRSLRPDPRQPSPDTGSPAASIEAARRAELADFLKARRAAIAPSDVGFGAAPRRRTRGLLREEVAQRAGISLTWYVWMEQARDIAPSADVIEHLADALILNEAERRLLRALARPSLGSDLRQALTQAPPADVQCWIDGLDQPAYAVNGCWDVLAWNDAARALIADFASVPPSERNILRMMFLWPDWRSLFLNWQELAASAVGQFRLGAGRRPGHPRIEQLVCDLARESAEFSALWRARQVDAPQLKIKRLRHPVFGERTFSYAPLKPMGAPRDLAVMVYAPVEAQ